MIPDSLTSRSRHEVTLGPRDEYSLLQLADFIDKRHKDRGDDNKKVGGVRFGEYAISNKYVGMVGEWAYNVYYDFVESWERFEKRWKARLKDPGADFWCPLGWIDVKCNFKHQGLSKKRSNTQADIYLSTTYYHERRIVVLVGWAWATAFKDLPFVKTHINVIEAQTLPETDLLSMALFDSLNQQEKERTIESR